MFLKFFYINNGIPYFIKYITMSQISITEWFVLNFMLSVYKCSIVFVKKTENQKEVNGYFKALTCLPPQPFDTLETNPITVRHGKRQCSTESSCSKYIHFANSVFVKIMRCNNLKEILPNCFKVCVQDCIEWRETLNARAY